MVTTAADAPAVAAGGPTTAAAAPPALLDREWPYGNPFTSAAYTLNEVRDYTGTPTALARRFVQGCKGREGLWGGEKVNESRRLWVSFLDLMELRFINAFHQAGWPWGRIRRLGAAARRELGLDYPFVSPRFQEAGPALFQRLAGGPAAAGQNGATADGGTPAFPEIIPPLLYESADYDGDLPLRWYPGVEWEIPEIGREVNLDPLRCGGDPTIVGRRLRTVWIAKEYCLEQGQFTDEQIEQLRKMGRRTPMELLIFDYSISEAAVLACAAYEEEMRRRSSQPSIREELIQALRQMREPYEFLLR